MKSSTIAKLMFTALAMSEAATRKVADVKAAVKPKVIKQADDIVKLFDEKELKQFGMLQLLGAKDEARKMLATALEKALQNRTIDAMSSDILAFLMKHRAEITGALSPTKAPAEVDTAVAAEEELISVPKNEHSVTSKSKETILTGFENSYEQIAMQRQIDELKKQSLNKDTTIFSLRASVKQIRRQHLVELQGVIGRINDLSVDLQDKLNEQADAFIKLYPESDECARVTEG